jgi:hypothetical protein
MGEYTVNILDGAERGIACVWFLSSYTPGMPGGTYENLSLDICCSVRVLNRVSGSRLYRSPTILCHLTETGPSIKVTPSYVLNEGCCKLYHFHLC